MIILHRQNNFSDIKGNIEFDVRSSKDGIILAHDPVNYHNKYPLLKEELLKYSADDLNTMIVNIKESGLEEEIIEIFSSYKLNFLFLDSQLPDIIRLSKRYPNYSSKFILRISEYECLNENLLKLVKPKYIWVDFSFNNFNSYNYFIFISDVVNKYRNYELILVSPELYDLNFSKYVGSIINILNIFPFLNICTKFPEKYNGGFNV